MLANLEQGRNYKCSPPSWRDLSLWGRCERETVERGFNPPVWGKSQQNWADSVLFPGRSPQEARGLPNAEQAREAAAGEEIHGGSQRDRWWIPSSCSQSHWNGTAWTEVGLCFTQEPCLPGSAPPLCVTHTKELWGFPVCSSTHYIFQSHLQREVAANNACAEVLPGT